MPRAGPSIASRPFGILWLCLAVIHNLAVIRFRAFAVTAGVSILLAAAGAGREAVRLGWSESSGLTYLQREVDRYVSERERALEASAQRVARMPDLVASATQGGDALLDLFSRLKGDIDAPDTIATTVWTPYGPARAFKVLAWNEGPAENVSAEVLNRAPAFAVVPGVAGLRLIYVHPVAKGEGRVAVAASETVISTPLAPSTIPSISTVDTAIGPLQVTPVTTASAAGSTRLHDRRQNRIAAAVGHGAARAAGGRTAHGALARCFSGVAAVAHLDRRDCGVHPRSRAPRAGLGAWLLQSLLGAALIAIVAVIAVWLGSRIGLPDVWMHLTRALAALAIVAAIPGSAWWLRLRRPAVRQSPVRWAVEQLAGGVVLAAGLARMAWLWRDRIDPTALEKWQLPVLASDVESVAAIAAVLLAQVAIAWAVAGVLGTLAARWRVHWRSGSGWLAVLLWMAPLALMPLLSPTPVPAVGIAVVGASAALFGLTATRLRRQYRSTSEARRLVLRFGSLLVPILVAYPLASALAERTTRTVIERDYGPATVAARQLDALMRTLERAQSEIDRVPNLDRLARPGADAEASSQAAFIAWNQTVLSKDRVTSEIELYDAERRLTSRFCAECP
jgi:hypothetical protein